MLRSVSKHFHQDQLIIVDWDEMSTVFDRLTGRTYFLSALPTEILRALDIRDTSAEQLARNLARRHEIKDDPTWRDLINNSLQQLQTLDLVELTTASS